MVAVPDLVDFRPTLPTLWQRCVAAHGDRDLAITPAGTHVSYVEADAASARLAAELVAAGVSKGTRVGILLPQSPSWIVAYLAVGRVGAVAVTISTFSRPYELARILRHSDTTLLITTRNLLGRDMADELVDAIPALTSESASGTALHLTDAPYLRAVWMLGDGASAPTWARTLDPFESGEPAVDTRLLAAIEDRVSPSDHLLVVYTSGTTSEPKGVIHTHGAIVRHGENLCRMEVAQVGDRIYAGMPFFWIGGVSYTLGPALHVGATLLLQERFAAGPALSFMARERATHITGWATLITSLRNHPAFASTDLSSMRRPIGSTHAPRAGLGMTETAASYIYFPPRFDEIPPDPRASGFAMDGFEVKVVDGHGDEQPVGSEGVICVRGYSLTIGLVGKERHETFDDDGWFATGDRGWVDPEGLVYFTGRDTEMIKTKGSNVAPPEVESVLLAHPAVTMATVVGIPNIDLGEEVGAAVSVRGLGNSAAPTAEDLYVWVRERLASYKTPRRILLVPEPDIPMLASGKIDRRQLAQWIEASSTR